MEIIPNGYSCCHARTCRSLLTDTAGRLNYLRQLVHVIGTGMRSKLYNRYTITITDDWHFFLTNPSQLFHSRYSLLILFMKQLVRDHSLTHYEKSSMRQKFLTHKRRLTSISFLIFSARQHICYSALYAIARPSVRPSVRLSVCPSHGWIVQKRLKLKLKQRAPQGSPMTLIFPCQTSPRNSKGYIGSGGAK